MGMPCSPKTSSKPDWQSSSAQFAKGLHGWGLLDQVASCLKLGRLRACSCSRAVPLPLHSGAWLLCMASRQGWSSQLLKPQLTWLPSSKPVMAVTRVEMSGSAAQVLGKGVAHHAIGAQVSEAQNSPSICDHDDLQQAQWLGEGSLSVCWGSSRGSCLPGQHLLQLLTDQCRLPEPAARCQTAACSRAAALTQVPGFAPDQQIMSSTAARSWQISCPALA